MYVVFFLAMSLALNDLLDLIKTKKKLMNVFKSWVCNVKGEPHPVNFLF